MIAKRIIVCGGRRYANRTFVYAALDLLAATFAMPMIVVHGKAPGADDLASQWCLERGVTQEAHPADWDYYGNSAGPRRNKAMAKAGAALCVAFPGGTGTESMIREATACGIEVVRMED